MWERKSFNSGLLVWCIAAITKAVPSRVMRERSSSESRGKGTEHAVFIAFKLPELSQTGFSSIESSSRWFITSPNFSGLSSHFSSDSSFPSQKLFAGVFSSQRVQLFLKGALHGTAIVG